MIRNLAPISAIVLLAACKPGPDRVESAGTKPPSLVPVSAIVNALKCELAETFASHDYVRDLIAPRVEASLTLSDVVARESGFEIGVEVVPAGITFGPSGSRSATRSNSNAIDFEFEYDVADRRPIPDFCTKLKTVAVKGAPPPPTKLAVVEGDPFITILDGINAEYAKVLAGDPKVTFGPLKYTVGFEVEKKEEFGAEISFLVFKIGGSRGRTNTSSQELSLTFKLEKLPKLTPP